MLDLIYQRKSLIIKLENGPLGELYHSRLEMRAESWPFLINIV
jgi:hypothetical protein